MQKLTAILLTGLLLFHWMGYQALYNYWMQQADNTLEIRLDKAEYNEQELVTIAIPLHLPYLTDQAEFERYNGEITFNSISYKYVQRRIYHDSLFVQCLPNQEAMRLNTARNDCFTFTTGIQPNTSGISKPGVAFTKHFSSGFKSLIFHRPALASGNGCPFIAVHQAILARNVCNGPDQPPEMATPFSFFS